eukprot:TRINITY_DN7337_c0_g1_i1.p1 TRINITY_DN7337_c0_g1~~TRINITY_DN7337_c0_g1_i1.p1  ORF type:complete len:808 (+),score=254.70 TRINITY_DN7337_c0_g1_i1:210-2633(+)
MVAQAAYEGNDPAALLAITFMFAVVGVAVFWIYLNKKGADSVEKKVSSDVAPVKKSLTQLSKPLEALSGHSISKKKREKKKRAAANKAKCLGPLGDSDSKEQQEQKPETVETIVEDSCPSPEPELVLEATAPEVSVAEPVADTPLTDDSPSTKPKGNKKKSKITEETGKNEKENGVPPDSETEKEDEEDKEKQSKASAEEEEAAEERKKQEEEERRKIEESKAEATRQAEAARIAKEEEEKRIAEELEKKRRIEEERKAAETSRKLEEEEAAKRKKKEKEEKEERKVKLDKLFSDLRKRYGKDEDKDRVRIKGDEEKTRKSLKEQEKTTRRDLLLPSSPPSPPRQPTPPPHPPKGTSPSASSSISPTEACLPIVPHSESRGIYRAPQNRPPQNGLSRHSSPSPVNSPKNDLANSAPCSPILNAGEVSYVLRKGHRMGFVCTDGILKLSDVPTRHAREKGLREGMILSSIDGNRPDPSHVYMLQQGIDREMVLVFTHPKPPALPPPSSAPIMQQVPVPIPPVPVMPPGGLPYSMTPPFQQPQMGHGHGHGAAPPPPLPMCKKDKLCQDINDPDHQKEFRHTCKIKDCGVSDCAWHTMYFYHETPTADEWNGEISVVDVDEHKRLLMKGNWAKVKVSKLKQLINDNLGITPAMQHITTKDGVPLVNDNSACKEYAIKAGALVYVTRKGQGPGIHQVQFPVQPQQHQQPHVFPNKGPVPPGALPPSFFAQSLYPLPNGMQYPPTNGMVRTGSLPQSQFVDPSRVYQGSPTAPLPYTQHAVKVMPTAPVPGARSAQDTSWTSGVGEAYHYS